MKYKYRRIQKTDESGTNTNTLKMILRRKNWGRLAFLLLAVIGIFSLISGVISLVSADEAEGTQAYICEENKPTEPETYRRYELTVDERLEIASVVTAEAAGEPFAGKVAVAQCILQACEDDGIRPAEALKKYGYAESRPCETQEALDAVQAVFDLGHVATTEPIKYFYAPEIVTSEWHETQEYVMTINGHRFFKEAK